ncbi:MAG TPA: SpoIIE family protein phosphatase [Terracidiphilus sp.]|jgi:hypothetical protein|nr:SpoIIE family protein phosphatase [Terracidiphilus sp.]
MKAILASALLVLAFPPLIAHGAPVSIESTQDADTAVPVTLGQSVVALTGPWKFHIGDNPQWADPSYDDSQWETVDLTPTPQTTLPGVPIPGFVSGWEARGHPRYAGYAWYRMRVRIRGAGGPLTLLAPEWFDGAFQAFANGHLVGSFGEFNTSVPTLYEGNPARFSLPLSAYQPRPDGTTLLAFRFYMAAESLGMGVRGGMHAPPRIGLPSAAAAIFHVEWESEYRRLASSVAAAMLYFLFALLIAVLLAFNRTEKMLLWPLCASALEVLQYSLIFSTNIRWMSEVRLEALIAFASIVAGYLWLLTWWAYFRLQQTRWLFNAILGWGLWNFAAAEFFTIILGSGTPSHQLIAASKISGLCDGSGVFLLIVAIAWLGWKREERKPWPLFIALFFFSFQVFEPVMALLHLRTAWQPFGVLLPFNLISLGASIFFFSIVLFGQFRASLKRQQATEEDLKQAQEVQTLLIPRHAPQVPGWRIESEYRPARQVGGDFFQVLPADDRSLLIVVGDVSGKGLQAAMTVSAIVGALRDSHERLPAQVLAHLNRVLCGQIGGFVTCCATLLAENGAMSIANAGHLSPYRNGEEVPLESGLPLGIAPDATYAESHIQLAPGDLLTFLSDGVVEAQSPTGELFGFERTAAISTQSAQAIATAAQAHGQQDDITVLTVARTPELKAVTA